jgi:hypothetical protein
VQRPENLRVLNLPNCAVPPIATTVGGSPVEVAQRVQTDSTRRFLGIRSVVVEVVQVSIEEAPSGQLERRALVIGPAKRCRPVDVARRINRQVAELVGREPSVRAVKCENYIESVLAAGTFKLVYRPIVVLFTAYRRAVEVSPRIQYDSGRNTTLRRTMKTVKDRFLTTSSGTHYAAGRCQQGTGSPQPRSRARDPDEEQVYCQHEP